MEINITKFFNEECPKDFSASIAEIGQNAGRDTWNAAMETAEDYEFITTENADEFRDYIRTFGAWEDSEIDGWNLQYCNALFIQMVSGDMREAGLDKRPVDWVAYSEDANSRGNIFRGDDDQIYYYVGS